MNAATQKALAKKKHLKFLAKQRRALFSHEFSLGDMDAVWQRGRRAAKDGQTIVQRVMADINEGMECYSHPNL